MALEKYGFFDSTSEVTREYTEADWLRFSRLAARNGVRTGNDLAITPGPSGLTVKAGYGLAMVYGHQYELYDDGGSIKTLSLTAPVGDARIDRIVLRLDNDEDTVTMQVISGAEGGGAPELTRTAATYEISLAQILVPVGAASIQAANITDERADAQLCGILHGVTTAELEKEIDQVDANAKNGISKAKSAASAAQTTANTAKTTANAAIPKVGGATQGDIPTFNASGALADSGVKMSSFTRAKMTLSGTTLTITTVN